MSCGRSIPSAITTALSQSLLQSHSTRLASGASAGAAAGERCCLWRPGDLGSVAALSQRTDRRGFRCQGVCPQVALATPGRSCGSEAAEAVPLRAWSKPHSRPAAQLNGARAEAFERRKHASASADRQLNEITGPQAGHIKGAGPQAKHLDINVTAREVRRHATLTMQERALVDPGRPPASPGRLALSVGNIQRSGAQRHTECRPSAIHIHIHRGWP